MLFLIRLFNDYLGFPLRRRYLLRVLLPLLPESGSILDLGCGDGKLAAALMKRRPGLKIQGADVYPQPGCCIPHRSIREVPYPFETASVDVVMLIDVLHHSPVPEVVLAEAARISRKTILLKDHYYTGSVGLRLLKIADYWGNKAYGVALPYRFLRPAEWEALFRATRLRVGHEHRFRYNPIDPCRHNLFLLEPTAG